MKKAISAVLVATMLATCVSNSFASVPSNRNNPKCIDIRNLNEKRWISLPEKPGKKVCGCKTCKVDVITFDKMPEYLQNLQKELPELDQDIRTNENKSTQKKFEDWIKAMNMANALIWVKGDIREQGYIGNNYYFISMDNNGDNPNVYGGFNYENSLGNSNEYSKEYFDAMIPQIDAILENREIQDKININAYKNMFPKLQSKQDKKEALVFMGILLGSVAVVSSIIGFLYHVRTLRHK